MPAGEGPVASAVARLGSMVQCVANGLLGNALDAAISCLVYAQAVGQNMTLVQFDGLPDIKGGTYPWQTLQWVFDAQGEPQALEYPGRVSRRGAAHKCMALDGKDEFLRRCTQDHIRGQPELAVRCPSSQNESTGLWQLRRNPDALIEACFAFAPADMSHDDFIASYRRMGAALHTVWTRRMQMAPPAHECDLGVHLRLGIRPDQRAMARQEEARFHVAGGVMAAAIHALAPSALPLVVSIDDHSRISETLASAAWLRDAVVLNGTSAIAQHFALQHCRRLLTYAFSSFSWTAAAMAPNGSAYWLATNLSGTKDAWYVGDGAGFARYVDSPDLERRRTRSHVKQNTRSVSDARPVRLPRRVVHELDGRGPTEGHGPTRRGASSVSRRAPSSQQPPCPAQTSPAISEHSTHIDPQRIGNSLPTCDGATAGSKGQWLPNAEHRCGLRAHYDSIALAEGPSGRCSNAEQPWAKLCWKPSDCYLAPFSTASFCDLVARHALRILVVGDSVSYLFYQALVHQLDPKANIDDARGPRGQWQEGGEPEKWWDPSGPFGICGGRGALIFRRNDQLLLESTDTFPERYDWVRYVADADVLILNKGAHVVPPLQYEDEMRDTVEFLRRAAADSSRERVVVFRSTPSGHPDCSMRTPPILGHSADAALSSTHAPSPSSMYNPSWRWDEFASRDAIARDLIETLPSGVFVNVTPMTMLRPDGHIGCTPAGTSCDCLHYFIPGPVDAWIQVLQHVLQGALRHLRPA